MIKPSYLPRARFLLLIPVLMGLVALLFILAQTAKGSMTEGQTKQGTQVRQDSIKDQKAKPAEAPKPAQKVAVRQVAAAPKPVPKLTDAQVLARIQATPRGIWAVGGSPAQAAALAATVPAGSLSSLVVYNIPGRDCGSYSSGGASSAEEYMVWVEGVATGINGRPVRVILEPDALALPCTDKSLVAKAMLRLKAAGAVVYIDAGHSSWIGSGEMATRLAAAGVGAADGFSLNVSNFNRLQNEISYGNKISALTGGKHFVIDTSRNGNGSNGEWCNPTGRALGAAPTLATAHGLVDAYLWVKPPGESDGTCNGGPTAGTWWPEYALGLGRAAGW